MGLLKRIFILCVLSGMISSTVGAYSLNRILQVRLTPQKKSTVVEIAGERAPNFTTFKQDTPKRVIVDVAECDIRGVPNRIPGDGNLISTITTAQYGQSPHGISRVSIQLAREAEYRVTINGGSLFVHITEGTGGLMVSAGIPVGPDRQTTPTTTVAMAKTYDLAIPSDAQDRALSEELSEPEQREPKVTPVVTRPTVDSKNVSKPVVVAQAEIEGDEEIDDEEVPPPPVDIEDDTAPEEAEDEAEDDTADEAEEVPPPPPVEEEEAEEEEETEEAEEVPEVPAATSEDVPEPPPSSYEAEEDEAEEAEAVAISSAMKHMSWVGFQQTQDTSRVFIQTNEPVRYRVLEESDKLVVLELENTTIPLANNRRFLDTHFFQSAVTMITPQEIEGVTRSVRIEIQLRNRVPYRTVQEENMVYVNFERPQ
jgi:hypothetical protein